MVETPVLFITFVRSGYARQTWEGIKAAKPKTLYFYSNKGRAEKEGEIERNEEIRSYIQEVDWACDVHTWFRDESVDIYSSLKGAISWLFENEGQGIIIEEDCVPTKAFFSFCDQMIAQYKDNKKVWCISGDNYLNYQPKNADYFFSHYHFMFGWASWRDRWEQIPWGNVPLRQLMDSDLECFYKSKREAAYRRKELKRCERFVQEKDCWDYAWGALIDINNGVTVHPKEHLVTSVGLMGTHSKIAKKTMFHISANPSDDTYIIKKHPAVIDADYEYDHEFFKKFEVHMRLYNRLYRRLYAKVKGYSILNPERPSHAEHLNKLLKKRI